MVLFESDALAKSLVEAWLVQLCINLRPSAVRGPLAHFQVRRLQEADIKRLVHGLNAAIHNRMPDDQVERSLRPYVAGA
jgi:hypothetical protein